MGGAAQPLYPERGLIRNDLQRVQEYAFFRCAASLPRKGVETTESVVKYLSCYIRAGNGNRIHVACDTERRENGKSLNIFHW